MLVLFCVCVCINGHNISVFQEKFVFSLIEGLREISVAVWNINTKDDFIGRPKPLQAPHFSTSAQYLKNKK